MVDPNEVVLGLDGGGTRTRLVAADAAGSIVAHLTFDSINPNDVASDVAEKRLKDALASLATRLGNGFTAASAFVGLGGVRTEATRGSVRALVARTCGIHEQRVGVHHDAFVALEGALMGKPGMIIVAGTGSICFGRDAKGREATCGNWGPMIGDEGSGYWLGREALRSTAHTLDGRAVATPLAETTMAWLGLREPEELLARLHEPDLTRDAVASLAPTVLQLAASGDRTALDIVTRGTDALASVVEVVYRDLFADGDAYAAVAGGLWTDGLYTRAFREAIDQRDLPVQLVEPALPPVMGAVLLALKQVGHTVEDTVVANLQAGATNLVSDDS